MQLLFLDGIALPNAARIAMVSDRVAALRQVELLKCLDDAALKKIDLNCTWIEAKKDKQIVTAQDNSTEVYFIVSGKVRVGLYSAHGDSVLFTPLPEGETFGELAAIDGLPRSATVEAAEDSRLAILSADHFRDLIRSYPKFSLVLMIRLTKDIRRLSERIYEFSTLAVRHRIQVELLKQAKSLCQGKDCVVVRPAPSPTLVSSIVSAHREAVSREVTRLQKLGLVRREPGALRFISIKALEALIAKEQGRLS